MLKYKLQFFGGRGSSSGGLGGLGGGASYSDKFGLPNGSVAEFDGELKFGGKDPNISSEVRASIEPWESKRVTAKVEYAYSVDPDGNPIGRGEIRGGKGSVSTPMSYHDTEGATFTHIHPRDESGVLGGTFSEGDMKNFANFGNTTERAAALEGTYSISKNANFDRAGFLSYVSQANKDFNAEQRAARTRIQQGIRDGSIKTYEQAAAASARAFNTALVNLHNTYAAGQSQYGYTYTLEAR